MSGERGDVRKRLAESVALGDGLTVEDVDDLRDWWDGEREGDSAGSMLGRLDATVARIVARHSADRLATDTAAPEGGCGSCGDAPNALRTAADDYAARPPHRQDGSYHDSTAPDWLRDRADRLMELCLHCRYPRERHSEDREACIRAGYYGNRYTPAAPVGEGVETVEWGVSCRGEVFPASEKNARSTHIHAHCADPVVVRRTVRVSEWSPVEPEIFEPETSEPEGGESRGA